MKLIIAAVLILLTVVVSEGREVVRSKSRSVATAACSCGPDCQCGPGCSCASRSKAKQISSVGSVKSRSVLRVR